jgi:hypothetical protein
VSNSRAAHARNLIGPLIRSAYRIDVRGSEHVPARGALLIVCDWNNIAAPGILKSAIARPVHVWASGPAALPGPLLSVTGDLAMPDARSGVCVVGRVIDLLQEGEAVVGVGVRDVGYVLARTGASVVVAAIDAPATKRPTDPPARKSEITVTLRAPHAVPDRLAPTRVTRGTARSACEWVRRIVADGVVAR